ncbi:hypothetical protein SERLADRAFT_445433 [Serpula lacrymans var. lacrymans S7.9]|uniref:DUF6593 domain-containing protein n=1 Tax=Serpula lacrymans var. lacrymans (strain S7.9) TaxID=578457 RepID=F8NH64_SERL9|nr:uncharacterized protein SERLADRAFT_445433 [Serpula lacrymans var. lacrymans S7.9]EGO29653.1 hypothetical protein SERLADRAFT_445433 [Serpula lacrymans var. lacrymans S7.9]
MQLTLSSDDVRDTTITNSQGQVIHKTNTPWSLPPRTTTTWTIRPNSSLLNMRDDLEIPSKLRFNGNEVWTEYYIPASGFIGRKYTFIGPDGRKYKRTSVSSDSLFIFPAFSLTQRRQLERGDGSNIPVACFHNGSLGIFGEHILDTVVLTFVYVEKLRKDQERSADSF